MSRVDNAPDIEKILRGILYLPLLFVIFYRFMIVVNLLGEETRGLTHGNNRLVYYATAYAYFSLRSSTLDKYYTT